MNAIERKAIIRKERKTIPKALKLDFRFNICLLSEIFDNKLADDVFEEENVNKALANLPNVE